jgi:hypothetical protein
MDLRELFAVIAFFIFIGGLLVVVSDAIKFSKK